MPLIGRVENEHCLSICSFPYFILQRNVNETYKSYSSYFIQDCVYDSMKKRSFVILHLWCMKGFLFEYKETKKRKNVEVLCHIKIDI